MDLKYFSITSVFVELKITPLLYSHDNAYNNYRHNGKGLFACVGIIVTLYLSVLFFLLFPLGVKLFFLLRPETFRLCGLFVFVGGVGL